MDVHLLVTCKLVAAPFHACKVQCACPRERQAGCCILLRLPGLSLPLLSSLHVRQAAVAACACLETILAAHLWDAGVFAMQQSAQTSLTLTDRHLVAVHSLSQSRAAM